MPGLSSAEPGLRDRHLLALPDDVGPEEVETLAASRFPSTRWEQARAAEAPAPRRGIVRPVTAAFGIRAVAPAGPPPGVGVLRLSRHTTLTGPYTVSAEEAAGLGLPSSTAVAYDVACTRERGERPYPGGDRDGLKRAFPDGMPVREEERVLLWLVAAARRLGGAVRTGERGTVLVPDVDSAVNLTVWADHWIEPHELLAVVQRVAHRARPADGGSAWQGPMAGAGRLGAHVPEGLPEPGGAGLRAALDAGGVRDEHKRRRLHAEADAFDAHMLANPPEATGFAVVVDLEVDGMVVVEVSEEEVVPPLLRDLPWTQQGAIAYRVRWEPFLLEELEAERPGLTHRVARGRAVPVVHAITRAVHGAVGGEIADEAEFLVAPTDL